MPDRVRLFALLIACACAGAACAIDDDLGDPEQQLPFDEDVAGPGASQDPIEDTREDSPGADADVAPEADASADDAGMADAASAATGGFVFSAYKDTSINMDWNSYVISTRVPGSRTSLATDMTNNGARTITLAFATGRCGSETWGGASGARLAAVNVPLLRQAGIKYIISTGGAGGAFLCDSDAGFATFIRRWMSPNLIGVDFDIEVGQSQAQIVSLVRRIKVAHASYPRLRFSLTIATLGNVRGTESLNATGLYTLAAVKKVFGRWPTFITFNLMTMNYGGPSEWVCVVENGECDMGQSAIQAALNLRAQHGIPLSQIELTPLIGGNEVQTNVFRPEDVDPIASFALESRLAGVHYWSYDRDVDCPPGPASPVCNTLGDAGHHGFLHRFLEAGLE
jgi:hypothetical protein